MASSANIGLFGTTTRTSTLLVVHMLGESHASEIAQVLGRSLSRIQSALDSLERTGIVVGAEEGKARRVRINPRYFAVKELKELLDRMGEADVELQQRLADRRRRPRRVGKEL